MSAPDKFRIYTRISPDEVMERIGKITLLPRQWSSKGKIYLGRIGDKSFEITRRLDRKAYKSSLPVVPILKFVPRFMKAKVEREQEFTTIDFETGEAAAVRSAWIMTASFIAAPPIFIVLFLILFLPAMYLLLPPGSKIDFSRIDMAGVGGKIGSYIGAWVGVSVTLVLFRFYDVYKFKKRYSEILAFEKQALAQIFDGQVADPQKS